MQYSQNDLHLLTDAKAVARARAFASRHSISWFDADYNDRSENPIPFIYELLADFATDYDWDNRVGAKKLKKAFDKVLSRAYNSPINGCTATHAVYFYGDK